MSTYEADRAYEIGRHYTGPKCVVFVVNNDRLFLSHRTTWGAALQSAGGRVTVIAQDTGQAEHIRKLGFEFLNLHVGRETSSVLELLTSAFRILTKLLIIRPDTVFLNAQVAYTLGWPAAILLRRSRFIRVVGGVGRGLDPAVLKSTASRIVQIAGHLAGRLPNVFTLFQVEHDRNEFIRLGLLPRPGRSLVIGGTGIDVDAWDTNMVRNFDKPVVLFASRLFREKGIYEFVEVAEKLRGRGWRFLVAGIPDIGVESAVTRDELDRWRAEGAVELLGYRTDMANLLAEATLLVLPTRHPEGTPKVLIEAGASGLPCIVSGHTGCTAVIEDGVTGVVLEPEPTVSDLATAVESVACDSGTAAAMGATARDRIRSRFSLQAVLTTLLEWEAIGAARL